MPINEAIASCSFKEAPIRRLAAGLAMFTTWFCQSTLGVASILLPSLAELSIVFKYCCYDLWSLSGFLENYR
jgi:hypothetical protein